MIMQLIVATNGVRGPWPLQKINLYNFFQAYFGGVILCGRLYKWMKEECINKNNKKYYQQNYYEHPQNKVVKEYKWKMWILHNHGKKKLLYLII